MIKFSAFREAVSQPTLNVPKAALYFAREIAYPNLDVPAWLTTTEEKIQDLRKRKAKIAQGGGEKRIEAQHKKGKLTARERIAQIFDPDTFQEMFMFTKHRSTSFGMDKKEAPGEGVITGAGALNGQQVFVASQDFTLIIHAKTNWRLNTEIELKETN